MPEAQNALPPLPWRASEMTPEVEAVIVGGRLVCDRLDRPLGIMRPAVAALLLRAREVDEAARDAMKAWDEWGWDGPPYAAFERLRTALGDKK